MLYAFWDGSPLFWTDSSKLLSCIDFARVDGLSLEPILF